MDQTLHMLKWNSHLKDINELHHIGMNLALFEKTDFSRTVDPLWHNLDGELLPAQAIHTTPANTEATVAQNCLFQVKIVTLEEWRILSKKQ